MILHLILSYILCFGYNANIYHSPQRAQRTTKILLCKKFTTLYRAVAERTQRATKKILCVILWSLWWKFLIFYSTKYKNYQNFQYLRVLIIYCEFISYLSANLNHQVFLYSSLNFEGYTIDSSKQEKKIVYSKKYL